MLHRLGDADAELGAQRRQLVDELGRRDQPARAEGGGEDLRGRAQVDDDVGVHAVQGRQRADVVAELAVVVVLDDDRAGGPGPPDQRLPAAHRKPPAERVLMGGRGVEQPEIAGELLGNDAVRVDPARHDPRPGPPQHLAAGGVARLLDAGLVARRQQHVRQQREPARHPLGDQDLLRPDGKPAGPAQVGGDFLAKLGEPVRVGPPGREVRARLPPRTPPGGRIDPVRPGDAGLQICISRGAAPRAPRCPCGRPRRQNPPSSEPPAGTDPRVVPGRGTAGGEDGGGLGDVGHVGAGAVAALEPPLREQAGVRVGHHRPAHAERDGQVAA